jgi:hypothetical protein
MVAGVEGRFRNAPRRAEAAAVVHLLLNDEVVGLVENTTLPLLHDQRRHQVFEHRARPGNQRTARTDRHDRPAKLVPVLRRQVALGDGKQAGKTGFGCQKIVAGFVEFIRIDAVTDRQQAPFRTEQEAEIHRKRDIAGPVTHDDQALTQRFDGAEIKHAVGNMRFAGIDEHGRPFRHFATLGVLHLMVEIDRKLMNITRQELPG